HNKRPIFVHDTSMGRPAGAARAAIVAVFELTKNTNGTYTESVLYSFTGLSDGSNLQAGLTGDSSNGNRWARLTMPAQMTAARCSNLSPPTSMNGPWTETTLYAFNNNFDSCVDGCGPSAGLLNPGLVIPGSLYGTTDSGGSSNCSCGTVFEVKYANGT